MNGNIGMGSALDPRLRWRPGALTLCLMAVCALARPSDAAETVWLDELDVSLSTCGWRKAAAKRSVGGNPLRIDGKRFERGIGTHSPGSFSIDLAGGAKRLTALVGIDDESRERGSVEFLVIGDGRLLWASGVVCGDDPGQRVDVDLTGLRLLELIVTTGGDDYAWDHADWTDARIESTGQRPRARRQGLSVTAAQHLAGRVKTAASLRNLFGYTRGATPGETYLRSVGAYRRQRAQFGPWRAVGPLHVKARDLDGRSPVDLNAAHQGVDGEPVRWQPSRRGIDGDQWYSVARLPALAGRPPLAMYLHRIVSAPMAQEQEANLRVEGNLRATVWLNGRRAGGRGRVRLRLREGANELLLRVEYVRPGPRLRMGFETRSEASYVEDLFAKIRADFPSGDAEPLNEYVRLERDIRSRRSDDPRYRQVQQMLREQAFRPEALLSAADRDPADIVLRRTAALLSHLLAMPGAPDLTLHGQRLAKLRREGAREPLADVLSRFRLFAEVRKLRRQIAFANPLLDFGRILFIKRHFLPPSERQGNHMCDQYFGFHAISAGGLFVLEDAFGPEPRERNVLADAVCEDGRFRGQHLKSGAVLSPDLSYDARTVLFAYTQAVPTRYEWSAQSTFHIFRIGVDGTGLRQLTDGPVNDFDPCFLPNGRIVFVSERRGGYGRCHGRPVPTFTLHTMDADGSDTVCISPHETNEWHPSVDHDGMIVYTRWDYVDRGHGQAHHPWIITPDGRDPRAIHGNYGRSRSARPNMEMDVRSIPGSRRYVATAAAHHGQAYGSLVIIDPRVEDDDAMGPLRRLTPDVRFPEAEISNRLGQVYATAWPLSEEFYLCVHDSHGTTQRGMRNNYGIYLLDAFGNRELIYRDPEISCLSPIPLRPRPRPRSSPLPDSEVGRGATARVGLVNVYDSAKPFPAGTTITALRIVQVLPKTTPYADRPRIGYGMQKNARAVLGTVPVEPDGSAYFELPAGKPVYFQALDESGLAVQSMRSDTWAHPGPRLVCQGCHEPRHHAVGRLDRLPLALRRAPSKIVPAPEGADPFSFPRLVQPVLDRHCVACHAKEAKAPDLGRGDVGKHPNRWYRSYDSLRRYAFYFGPAGWTEPLTLPGKFGARASKLYPLLRRGHHGLELPAADLQRIALWLDCNSDFFGSYESIDAQARGETVRPTLE